MATVAFHLTFSSDSGGGGLGLLSQSEQKGGDLRHTSPKWKSAGYSSRRSPWMKDEMPRKEEHG